jgi:hypothetical protein
MASFYPPGSGFDDHRSGKRICLGAHSHVLASASCEQEPLNFYQDIVALGLDIGFHPLLSVNHAIWDLQAGICAWGCSQ